MFQDNFSEARNDALHQAVHLVTIISYSTATNILGAPGRLLQLMRRDDVNVVTRVSFDT
jgi:hypothetical protein